MLRVLLARRSESAALAGWAASSFLDTYLVTDVPLPWSMTAWKNLVGLLLLAVRLETLHRLFEQRGLTGHDR